MVCKRTLRLRGERQLRHRECAIEQREHQNHQKVHATQAKINTMALYLIGDVQGCDAALQKLLDTLAFSPSRDTLYFWATWSTAGPALRPRCCAARWPTAAPPSCVLGNHDLHLLALACRCPRAIGQDTVADVLQAPDRDALVHWLARSPWHASCGCGARHAACPCGCVAAMVGRKRSSWRKKLHGTWDKRLASESTAPVRVLSGHVRQRAHAGEFGGFAGRTAHAGRRRCPHAVALLHRAGRDGVWTQRTGQHEHLRATCRGLMFAGAANQRRDGGVWTLVQAGHRWHAPMCWPWTPAVSGAAA